MQPTLFDVPKAENTGVAHCVCGMNYRGATCPHCKRARYQVAAPADWPDGIPPSLWSPGALAAHKLDLPLEPPVAEATTIGGGCGAKGPVMPTAGVVLRPE